MERFSSADMEKQEAVGGIEEVVHEFLMTIFGVSMEADVGGPTRPTIITPRSYGVNLVFIYFPV